MNPVMTFQDEPLPEDPQGTVHHVSPRAKRPIEPVRMQLNLTSMIDVIFLLLIYFVITASFTPNEGVLTAELPQQGAGAAVAVAEPEAQELRIVLTESGYYDVRISIENVGSFRDFDELTQRLEALQHTDANPGGTFKPDDPILIRPSGRVRWQHVVNAFNSAVRARYENISFLREVQP